MATSFPRRLLRGLRWAFLGRPAAPRIGRLDRPRVLYVEATVVGPETVTSLEGGPASWVKVLLLEIAGSPYRASFDALRQAVAPREGPGPGVRYEVVGEIVRGHDLALETSDGEPLLLRSGTFDLARPDLRPAMRLMALPPELRGVWPGGANARPFSRELVLRRGDSVRFEALFVPEKHPRSGTGYRGDVDVRHRVEPAGGPILLYPGSPRLD